MQLTSLILFRALCQTRCCLFGAGVMLGSVKKVSLPKITYSDWELSQATRNELASVHHPLVTEYFLRLDAKRAALETVPSLEEEQEEELNKNEHKMEEQAASLSTSHSKLSNATDTESLADQKGIICSKSKGNNSRDAASSINMIEWNRMYCHELEIAEKLSKLLRELNESVNLREQLRQRANHSDGDVELLEMVMEDINTIKERIHHLDNDVNELVKHRLNAEDVIGSSSRTWHLTVVGKAGGEEAHLFALELFEMFRAYALEIRHMNVREVKDNECGDDNDNNIAADDQHYSNSSRQTIHGSGNTNSNKNVSVNQSITNNETITSSGKTLMLTGDNVYRYFHHEIGVHKVQRVPVTDNSGKMQTSTACVTLMPVLDPLSVNVREEDCKIDYVRGSGPGGQGMQSSSNCVVLQHIPTGIRVKCHQSRSALGNKELALQQVAHAILTERVKQQKSLINSAWENQWSSGERSEKMRTYNYPQNRVTDHRLGKDYALINFMEGGKGLEEVHDALNEISELHELTSVLLKHINGNFNGCVGEDIEFL